jgi:hypothetical protein
MTQEHGGLDLTRTDVVTDAEKQAFKTAYQTTLGRPHVGLDYWLENGPDVLKRYRAFAEAGTGSPFVNQTLQGFYFLELYSLTGYTEGVKYVVRMWQNAGLTRSQVLEWLAIGFLHAGPRGMETIAEALAEFPWIEPATPPTFPDGWGPDPEAFASGLDFTTPDLTDQELRQLKEWYLRWLGEVPAYVDFLATFHPRLLKAYRNRFEHCATELPKQVVPATLLHFNVIRSNAEGIRENVLLCKGFDMTMQQTQRPIWSALLNGGVEAASVVSRAAGDIFASWS